MAQQSLGSKLAGWAIILVIAGVIVYFKHRSDAPPPAPEPGPPIDDPYREPAPDPLGPPHLKTTGDLHWKFVPDKGHYDTCTLLIDNGSAAAVTVGFDEKSSVAVPAGKQGEVTVLAGARPVKISEGDDPAKAAAQTVTLAGEGGLVYVVNPGAAWDYRFETQDYSTMTVGFGGHTEKTLAGLPFFCAGRIDYKFEPLPESVEIYTYGGYGTATKTRLSHLREPASPRTVTAFERDGQPAWVVATGENEWTVSTSASTAGLARVYLDPGVLTLAIQANGKTLFTVAGEVAQLRLTAGPWTLTAAVPEGAAGTALTPLAATLDDDRYLWSPTGSVVYGISYERYGPGLSTAPPPALEELRGLRFCRIPTMFAFEEFPATIKTSGLSMGTVASRLDTYSTGDATALAAALAEDFDKELAAAKQVEGHAAPAITALAADLTAPHDDLQIRALRAAHAEFEADGAIDEGIAPDWQWVADRYKDVAQFQPAWPQFYVRQGKMLMRMKSWYAAKKAFEEAVRLKPELEKELTADQKTCQDKIDHPEPEKPDGAENVTPEPAAAPQ